MEGRIIKINHGVYSVEVDGIIFETHLKSSFRFKKVKAYVGDIVNLDKTNSWIIEIKPRYSYIKRPEIANIDQLVIVTSIKEPDFSYYLILKFLTYANLNNIKPIIIITKCDLLDDKKQINEIKEIFKKINVDTYFISNKKKDDFEPINKIFDNKISCLLGQTGVGKSSLLNNLDENFARAIGEFSDSLNRGKHKTTEIALLKYNDSYIADTPGFSSLDLDLYQEDISIYFPYINQYYNECKFPNCCHINVTNCNVIKALDDGLIPQVVYDSYVKLFNESIPFSRRFKK